MKRPAASADAAASSPPARPPIQDQLAEIEMSILDRLLGIRREEEQLREFRDRAEKHRTDVSESVYRRVVADYANRASLLEQQAQPLRSKARTEYRKLRQLAEQIGRAYERAKLEKEELEFRHAVGELDADQYGRQLQEPQRLLDGCRADVACIDEHKARFIEAMGSEAALEEPAPPERAEMPPRPAPPAVRRVDTGPVPALGPTERAAPGRVQEEEAAPPPPPPPPPQLPQPNPSLALEVPDDPILVALQRKDETLSHFLSEEAEVAPAPPVAPDEQVAEPTILVPLAALTSGGEWGVPKEFQLGTVTYLGRGGGNHLQITSPSVSRKHAVITASPRGFTVKDLNSQNGVSVNSERVTERLLSDGDRVEIGDVIFVFRSPWPTLGAAKHDAPGAEARSANG